MSLAIIILVGTSLLTKHIEKITLHQNKFDESVLIYLFFVEIQYGLDLHKKEMQRLSINYQLS